MTDVQREKWISRQTDEDRRDRGIEAFKDIQTHIHTPTHTNTRTLSPHTYTVTYLYYDY